jgi:hypothetical protein
MVGYESSCIWRNLPQSGPTANDGPLALVSAAILAASPHNTQPWLFKITNSSIELHIDTQRNVGALDHPEQFGQCCVLLTSLHRRGYFSMSK